MFQGMTIEELIKSVERAERHAREEQSVKTGLHHDPAFRMQSREMVEVA